MTDWRARTASVTGHPRVVGLGRDSVEQLRVEAFARDLAAWLAGAPRGDLGVLTRVVTALGGPTLRQARAVSLGLPLLAIESSARATEVLWPWLRDPHAPEPEEVPPDGQGDSGEGHHSEAGTGNGPGVPGLSAGGTPPPGQAPGEDGEARDPEADARAVLAALAETQDLDDPELDALARAMARLGEQAAEATADALQPVGEQAFEGAKEGEDLARALESLVPGVGWGMAPGHLHAALGQRLDRLVTLLERLPELREIADRLGRSEAEAARAAQREGGSEEVTGVRFGGDVTSALPSELALLGDEDTEDLFYQRFLERRLVSLELSGSGLHGVGEPRRRGPVLGCIDTSGSMGGAPEAAAKALVLAVCRRVLPQGRAVHLLLFGAKGEATELRLLRGRGGLEALLDFLAMRFDGGTDFDTPLVRALELTQERALADADVLVVTDGYARAAPAVVEAVAEARRARGLRVWSVVLGAGGVDGVTPFSDEVWQVQADGSGSVGLARRLSR